MPGKYTLRIALLVFILSNCKYTPKIDSDDSGLFLKMFGGAYNEEVFSAVETPDGGYAIIGSIVSLGRDTANNEVQEENVYLIKTDRVGNKLWDRTFPGTTYWS